MNFDVRVPLIALVSLLATVIAVSAEDKPVPGAPVHLQQGWSEETADRWHFISQGTALIPYEWFVALEQPGQPPGQTALIKAPENLQRLGFLPEPASATNPDGLAIGLYSTPVDIPDGRHACWKGNWLGLGCAGCHTGQVSYRGQQIRIEGGPSHIDIDAFVAQLVGSIGAVLQNQDGAAQRFMARVKAPPADVQSGLQCFGGVLQAAARFNQVVGANSGDTAGGAGRLDAHGAGLNQLLAGPFRLMTDPADIGETRNYAHLTAPVRYPALWDTPRFNWVLYNASIRQPLTRNIVEALGVLAPIKHDATMIGPDVMHGIQMENVVWGQRKLMDLRSPRWPEAVLGALDPKRALRGQLVYVSACANCHDAAPTEVASGACSEIQIPLVDLRKIGTDPEQATTFNRRKIALSKIGGPDAMSNYKAAEVLTGNIAALWIARSKDNAASAAEINCGRPNQFRAPLAYRARPLNGIWAMAPYLHNGSVPSLNDLLLPPSQRPKTFYVGNWEYNPDIVGYDMKAQTPGAFLFDTSVRGNSNAGHTYGTDMTEDDRKALIEYLKTL
ncbi:di-heme-cytochrome C peroxidase [Bradyrhizobium guangdongense]